MPPPPPPPPSAAAAADSWWIETCFQFLDVCTEALESEGLMVKAQGSFAQGLALDGSDLDAVIYRKGEQAPRGKALVNALMNASRRIIHYINSGKGGAANMHIKTIERIPWARIPLVKLRFSWDWPSGRGDSWVVEVDLSYGDETRGSYDNRIGEMVASLPELRVFLQELKIWAVSRPENILDSQHQALSTFALILLGLCYYNNSLKNGRGMAATLEGFIRFIVADIGNLHSSVCYVKVEEGEYRHVADDDNNNHLTRSPFKIEVPGEGPESNAARSLSRKMWMEVVYPSFKAAAANRKIANRSNRRMVQVAPSKNVPPSKHRVGGRKKTDDIRM
ncbi:hypothetical protein FOL47_003804 [Perkinsus chesapeaki]|uniref:Poly(A) RNA polymerase mitochondrial-like central palm domain-containing protein n=1 Tax=Perkinsus chesapeaki TaxID=330153 RepID=A0A7J6M682_PERCH|nr:hypothetical protein FOL47_003804 [Perkinsus chesapeaki]